ncbi:MAG: class I SAM-dependent methyltransferase family protein [Desulfurococcales archaeon]|nr:class I SAM-dependent methyltransferase family protein [Desulfurococcales archaeon]
MLKSIASEVLGEEKAREVWSRIDVVGDIAIIKKPLRGSLQLEDFVKIGERLVEKVKYINSVWLAASPVEGDHRVRRNLVHLAGEKRTVTVYREHGCAFLVDVSKVFVTPRLSFEHYRVARLVRPGEVIVNMFAGAGIFSIVIAKIARPRRVYSIDINKDAYRLMERNTRLNGVEDIVIPLHGDAAEIVSRMLRGVANRVLMPLPMLALDYLEYASLALKDRGVIHVYLHVGFDRGENPSRKAVDEVVGRLEELRLTARKVYARVVRPVGPRRVQVAVDVEVERGG